MSTKLNLKQLAQSRQKKIDSPLAKYNATGQLFCVLCNAQVKNEIYWTGHVNGKAHKDNLSNLKKAGPPQTSGVKRPATDNFAVPAPPSKVVKVEDDSDSAVRKAEEELKLMIGGGSPPVKEETKEEERDDSEESEKPGRAVPLPEGFFDDPKEDAKARGQKFRDPQDVEWEKFVKEIATEDVKSSEIVEDQQEKSAVERELDHIEEQMAQWQRVIELEKKAEEYAKMKKGEQTAVQKNSNMDVDDEENEDEDNLDYDEELDWRNKKR